MTFLKGQSAKEIPEVDNPGIPANDCRSWYRRSFLLGTFAFVVYAVLSALHSKYHLNDYSIFRTSQYAYFNYLADAFLHGQFHLRLIPEHTHDLIFYDGLLYLYWPPFPAILLAPFVMLFGVHFSDILFTLVVAGLNVSVVSVFLSKLRDHDSFKLSTFHLTALILFFSFGTVHLTMAPLGRVWFTAQLIGFLCVSLTYLASVSANGRWAFFIAGLALTGATTTRAHLLFLGIWPAYILFRRYRLKSNSWKLTATLSGLLPLSIGFFLFLFYNYSRFGNPFELGMDFHMMASIFTREYEIYGPFSLHYLPINLYYQYIYYPLPISQQTWMGGSIFLLSPLFIGALFSCRKQFSLSTFLLILSILFTSIPILLLMGTGWVQFGPRYTLDFTLPLLILTGIGIRKWPRTLVGLLTAVSIIHYAIGVFYLGRLL